MQIVIDIPEDHKRVIDNLVTDGKGYLLPHEVKDTLARAVKIGTPLPKGHGRLIDADELKKVYDERITYLYALNKKDNPSRESRICATNWCANTIDELPTIIEANKE